MADIPAKPRLLVITSTYPRWRDDTEPSFVHQLASRLTNRFDVVVSTSHTLGAKTAEIMDGVLVLRYRYAPAGLESLVYGGGLLANLKVAPWKIALLPGFLLAWAWHISQLQRGKNVDIVHAHWFIPGGLLATLVAGNAPLCVTAHGTDVLGLKGRPWQWLRRLVARRAIAITAVGKGIQDVLHSEQAGIAKLQPMGVDLSNTFFPPDNQSRSSRLLFVGRLVESKRPEVTLLAFAEVLKMVPDLNLDMVGDGPQRHHLENLSEELGIRSQVTFHGRKGQTEIASISRCAVAMIIPSGSDGAPEGLCLVAIEALGCGCPVISVPNTALQAVIPASAPIFYALNDTSASVAQTLLAFLQAPPPDMSNVADWQKQLLSTFDWPNVAESYGALLEELLPHP